MNDLPILSVRGGSAPFPAVVLVEDTLLGRVYAGTVRADAFARVEAGIHNGFPNLDLPPLEWVECRSGGALPVRHRLLLSILAARMRARATGGGDWL